MTAWFTDTSFSSWLLSTALSVICFGFAASILYRERRNRMKSNLVVTTKYLTVSSYFCIIIGSLSTALYSFTFIPGYSLFPCLLHHILAIPSAYIQFAAMECYQLSRLYYCFSRNQVHSNKGYPNCLFITLIFVLAIWVVSTLMLCFYWLTLYCPMERMYSFAFLDHYSIITVQFLYASLELTTVFLYWYKVRSLRPNQDTGDHDRTIDDRIQSILHRVLILTYFYLFISGSLITLFEIWTIAAESGLVQNEPFGMASVCVLSVSYSMFLMQDHNTSEYVAFLRFIKRYKCILCFCCFASMVREQHRMYLDNLEDEKVQTMDSAPTFGDYASPTYNNNTTGMELSVATRTTIRDIVITGVDV